MIRYPLEPLLRAAGMTLGELREWCPMNGATYRNARTQGLTEAQADRWACKVGLVPWLVWPTWLDDLTVPCDECSTGFVRSRKSQRFCTPACQQRNQKRRWYRTRYQTDPEFRARENGRSRTYQSTYSEYLNRQMAARYQATRDDRRAYDREYREQNRELLRERRRAYYLANRERIIARQLEYDRRRRAEQRERAA